MRYPIICRMYNWMSRHWTMSWVVLVIIPVFFWAIDRKPPFEVVRYFEPAPAVQGAQVLFVMPVRRDVERGCDAEYTRHIVDAAGVRYDYGSRQIMSAHSIEQMHNVMGPWLKASIVVPSGATPGRATLVTDLEYSCNPLHAIWPIKKTLYFSFEVQASPAHNF